jgi:uncharacterized protein (TIGR03790 family)
MRESWIVACVFLLVLGTSAVVGAQTGQNVLVVVNAASADSVRIGEHYARARAVPAGQVLRIEAPVAHEIPRGDYERAIEVPIAKWLNVNAGHDRILYIVLTRGVPVRIAGTAGRLATLASVDSELALLYRKMTGRVMAPQGDQPNPYYLREAPVAEAKPFTHVDHDIFLVTRLDGFSGDEAVKLIDRAINPATSGHVVLDMKAAYRDKANDWLAAAADRLNASGLGDRVVLEATPAAARTSAPVLGYYSWGSNDAALLSRTTGLTFAPGAIASLYVATSGRTFAEPPASWVPGRGGLRDDLFEGSADSLAADLVREGVTGVAAYVADPFLDRAIRPDVLLPAYFAGFTLAEAYYLAMPSLSWQTVVIGDPLCRPFGTASLSAEQLDPGVDPATETPREFTRRWIAVSREDTPDGGGPLRTDGLQVTLKARARLAREDKIGARDALVEATRLEPRLNGAQFLLASYYEEAGEFEQAADRYRAILANKSTDILALNNLAYHLATRADKAGEALPLAQRAYVLSRGEPNVTDTLAWVHHLLGNGREAVQYVGEAVARGPNLPEARVHAAAIYLAAGQADIARTELQRALELDPALANRGEVKALQEKLGPAQ